MKIAHYIDNLRLESGGTVRTVLDLCTMLAARGHEILVFTHDAGDAPADWHSPDTPGPTVHVVGRSGGLLRSMPRADRARVAELVAGFDAAHVHAMWELASAHFADACARAGVPTVISAHGMLDDWCMAQGALKKKLYLALVQRKRLARAGFVHTTASAEKDQASKWIGSGRGIVVPHVFDLTPYRNLPGPELAQREYGSLLDGRPAALFLSRIHHKKGVDRLLRMARALRDAGSDAAILIAGTGDPAYEQQMRTLHTQLGLDDRVAFLGMVTGELKYSLYQAADLFVLPTSQENWGFVFFEAMGCGTPVLTTRGVDPWPELEGSGAGVIVPTEIDPGELATIAGELLADQPRLTAMGERGRAWVLAELDPQRVVGRFEQMYRDAGARPAGAASR